MKRRVGLGTRNGVHLGAPSHVELELSSTR